MQACQEFLCAVIKLQATIGGVPMHVTSRKLQASASNTPFSDSYAFNMGCSKPVAVIHFGHEHQVLYEDKHVQTSAPVYLFGSLWGKHMPCHEQLGLRPLRSHALVIMQQRTSQTVVDLHGRTVSI